MLLLWRRGGSPGCHLVSDFVQLVLPHKKLVGVEMQEFHDPAYPGETRIQQQHYQNFEYGTRQFSKSTAILVLRICAVLELDPYEVVFGTSKDWIRRIR